MEARSEPATEQEGSGICRVKCWPGSLADREGSNRGLRPVPPDGVRKGVWQIEKAQIAGSVRFLRTEPAKEGLGRRPRRRCGLDSS